MVNGEWNKILILIAININNKSMHLKYYINLGDCCLNKDQTVDGNLFE